RRRVRVRSWPENPPRSPHLPRLPWITLVETQAHVTARARRPAEPNFAPRVGMRVVDAGDRLQQHVDKETARIDGRPQCRLDVAFLNRVQHYTAIGCIEPDELSRIVSQRLGIDAGEAGTPAIA